MKIRPLADKVLVQRLEAQNKTTGGIVLPDSAKEKPQRGKIISVGDGKVLDDGTVQKLQVKKGDMVLFTSYAGTEVKIDGKEYLIMSESDISKKDSIWYRGPHGYSKRCEQTGKGGKDHAWAVRQKCSFGKIVRFADRYKRWRNSG